jgi:O-antigen/teichoic acid export membrane protein
MVWSHGGLLLISSVIFLLGIAVVRGVDDRIVGLGWLALGALLAIWVSVQGAAQTAAEAMGSPITWVVLSALFIVWTVYGIVKERCDRIERLLDALLDRRR